MTAYAIRTNARYGEVKYLYLSNDSNEYWTTNDPTHVRKFTSYSEAQKELSVLRYNNPVIVPYNVALLDVTTGVH